MHSKPQLSSMRVALGLVLVSVLTACGGDEPAAEPALIPPAVVDETEEVVVDPNVPQPDAAIEAVVVDADTTTTVAGDDGRIPTPEAPVIEAVAYDDLAYVEGERVIIRTQMGSTREGVLKRFLNTGLKLVVNERGRQIELDMPRSTIAEAKVVWTKAQGVAPVPAPAP